jgi:hypothetical protein
VSKELLSEGGPHKIKKTGHDEYTFRISIPENSDGRLARECPSAECSPGYFKVKIGTGITEGQEVAYCPYCRTEAKPSEFTTKEQIRFAKDIVLREAHEGAERMIKDALGIGPSGERNLSEGFISIGLSYKPGLKPHVHRPFEEEVKRDILCPSCGLDHSVYGLAIWCADCGEDIFLTHVEAELDVIKIMLSDIDRRREKLGIRIAAKDLENCLEDTVSIFEAVMRALVKRYLIMGGTSNEDVEKFYKKIGNAFQNIRRTNDILEEYIDIPLLNILTQKEFVSLGNTFEKRHPITHNLGVVDKKYIERARSAEKEGREVLISQEDIEDAIRLSLKIFNYLHQQMFPMG